MSKVDLRLQCGMPCSKLEVSTAQHGTLSGAGYLHQSRLTQLAYSRRMAAICAKATAGVDVKRPSKIATVDLGICAERTYRNVATAKRSFASTLTTLSSRSPSVLSLPARAKSDNMKFGKGFDPG